VNADRDHQGDEPGVFEKLLIRRLFRRAGDYPFLLLPKAHEERFRHGGIDPDRVLIELESFVGFSNLLDDVSQ
jgi:hypothetical protein